MRWLGSRWSWRDRGHAAPRSVVLGLLGLAVLLSGLAVTAAFGDDTPTVFDPAYEAQNYSKLNERPNRDNDPAFQALLAQEGAANEVQAANIIATDPARNFTGNLCWQHSNGCAGDIRLYHWGAKGYGNVVPVLWTARNGSTISGHVWYTNAGPAKRPGVVITNGSVQAPEELYLFAAETLAKRGYLVLTWDPQGQGYSDTYGEGADMNDGVPSQSGEPFYDGTEDALDFFFSSPSAPYHPRKSCSSGTDHYAKQASRVAAGLDAPYNPGWALLDRDRVGLAGHSLGAAAISYVGQADPRVKVIVAWDNLGVGTNGQASASTITCASGSSSRADVPITKPALGLSADYGLFRQPNTSLPDPLGKSTASRAYSSAHQDTGEIIIRGGSHYEFSYIPNQYFGASLRGMDMVAWYTDSWFDKYLMHDPTADSRLLTQRWRADAQEAAVDPTQDGNIFSRYYHSRLDIGLSGGGRFLCENLRPGLCPGMVTNDGQGPNYSYEAEALTPDQARGAHAGRGGDQLGAGPSPAPPGSGHIVRFSTPCASHRRLVLHLSVPRRLSIRRATVIVAGRRAAIRAGRRLTIPVNLRGLPRGTFTVYVVLVPRRGAAFTVRRTFHTCVPGRPRHAGGRHSH